MFYSVFSKDSLDELMTMFFRNLGLVDDQTDLLVRSLVIDNDSVEIEADVEQETLQ